MTVESDQLDAFMRKLKSKIGKDKHVFVGRGGEAHLLPSHIPFGIPTGVPMLDYAIRHDGWPAGRIVELFGFEMSGKTALALASIAQVQAMGGAGAWIEAEHTFDKQRAIDAGIDLERLAFMEVDSIEGVFRAHEAILGSLQEASYNRPFIIVTDSITAVSPEQELEQDLDKESRMGGEAKSIKRGLRRLCSMLSKQKITCLFVNHAISEVAGWGATSKSGGGHALKFFASVRVSLAHAGFLKDSDKNRVGQTIRFTVEKVKGKHNQTMFKADLKDGRFDRVDSLLEACKMVGMVAGTSSITIYPYDDSSLEEIDQDDWPTWVKEHGGFQAVYRKFMERAVETGAILPWGGDESEED